MNKIYEIWWKYGDREYRVVDFLSFWNTHYRDEVRSSDFDKVTKVCERLNFIAASDERYEIREVFGPLDF